MKPSIRIADATERNILDDLIQLYLKEFQCFDFKIRSSEGRLLYPYLDHYWRNPHRYPFLISKEQQIAGFALLRVETNPSNGVPVTEISDFFIHNSLRHQGLGKKTAVHLWDMFPGNWRLEVHKENREGLCFWEQTIGQYTEYRFKRTNTAKSSTVEFLFQNTIHPP